ncbi:MAG: type II toxin-antitoxin system VapC family toxin [Verrucomicrobia bacterium]|nr:type II toxin-antitoxin system VapC family toxin [Verrucomicrobiota bacterium]MCH8526169.1 type II toxin-antitoxin system VapC family toxin [Kiritimatiellia bacterium]
MNVLLDTCAILHLSIAAPCVTAATHKILADAESVFLSPISTAELACLQERGRIQLPMHWKPWLRAAIAENGWEISPISLDIMEEAYSLPGTFHSDPADRVLTATARLERLLLLTTDQKILEYPHVISGW